MNTRNHQYEYVGIGLYTLPEAASLLRTSRRTIRRWMQGHDYSKAGSKHHVAPLWTPDILHVDGEIELSFRDLIELRFVQAFVAKGLHLTAIRNCLNYAKECIQSDRPFLTGKFRTDGRTIFLESQERLEASHEAKLLDLRVKQFVFKSVVEQTFRDLDLEDGLVSSWRPFKGKVSIVIDPKRSFGQPIAALTGIPTIALAEAVKAEKSVARVAKLFEVERKVVQDAVNFHVELLVA